MTETIAFPGARRPDRQRTVDSGGLALAVYEWGAEDAPPLLLAHGGFDFAGTFDVFAPLLADGGWRVVSWDQRGHGDSEHAVLYNWEADCRDALAVLDSTTPEPERLAGASGSRSDRGAKARADSIAARPQAVRYRGARWDEDADSGAFRGRASRSSVLSPRET